MLDWCANCKNRVEKGIKLSCLACKWQYVGQEAFNRKENLFKPDNEKGETLDEYFNGRAELIGCEVL